MKIYCDTNTLPHNIHHRDAKSRRELEAVTELAARYRLHTSKAVKRELLKTGDQASRDQLGSEDAGREAISDDEKVHGFHFQSDPYGGGIANPLVSDVQDEAIRDELEEKGLRRPDAEHIVQAVCNKCDVFLTRDEKTIIEPHRVWLEKRFPGLKVRLPTELLQELGDPTQHA